MFNNNDINVQKLRVQFHIFNLQDESVFGKQLVFMWLLLKCIIMADSILKMNQFLTMLHKGSVWIWLNKQTLKQMFLPYFLIPSKLKTPSVANPHLEFAFEEPNTPM